MTPQEGAFAWLDGLAIPIGAKNFDETYTFLNYIYDSEVNGLIANETGYNPVSIVAENYLSADSKKAFGEAYPGDALDRLWWWQPSHPWYTEIRAAYSDKYVAARPCMTAAGRVQAAKPGPDSRQRVKKVVSVQTKHAN